MRLAFLLACVAACVAACQRERPAAPAASAGAGDSLYLLDVHPLDEHGQTIGLDVFAGHRVLTSMFYGRCPSACPLLVSTIQEIEARLPRAARADLRVLLVSFDPEHDTPAALAEMADVHGVDRARWRFASLPEDDARALAAVLGFHYRRMGDQFQHDVALTLLDDQGRVVARAASLREAREKLPRMLGQ